MKFNNHRYTLRRDWLGNGGIVNFVMLNPSTADAISDDPTIRRCVGFAKRWGFAGIVVTNCFAYRSTSPVELLKITPQLAIGGLDNDEAIGAAADEAKLVVCAWGDMGTLYGRAETVREILQAHDKEPHILGFTKNRNPRHPLMFPYGEKPRVWGTPNQTAEVSV